MARTSGPRGTLDAEAFRLVCSISAGMLGICFTGIGLMRVVISIRHRDTLADDLLCLNALMFLVTLMLAYIAIRSIPTRRLYLIERAADVMFLLSMSLLTVNCFFVTYAISSM